MTIKKITFTEEYGFLGFPVDVIIENLSQFNTYYPFLLLQLFLSDHSVFRFVFYEYNDWWNKTENIF